jgi:hypothetical protein
MFASLDAFMAADAAFNPELDFLEGGNSFRVVAPGTMEWTAF